jgi:uncharacterized protein
MTLATSLYAAALTPLYIVLSINVIRGRRRHSVALGDGDIDDMKPRIRAHANFAEYAPLFLILLALAEYQGLAKPAVHALGMAFATARLAHAYGLMIAEPRDRWFTPRVAAIGTTFTCLAILSGVLLFQTIF